MRDRTVSLEGIMKAVLLIGIGYLFYNLAVASGAPLPAQFALLLR